MKTKEQHKQEVIDYLTKTSKHTFQYPDGSLYKIIKDEDKFFVVDEKAHSNYKVREINIAQQIIYYGNNTKCVIKHQLFLDRKTKSIRTNKYTNERINDVYNQLNKK